MELSEGTSTLTSLEVQKRLREGTFPRRASSCEKAVKMHNFTACLIVLTVIAISSDWLPQSNVFVEAGGALYSTNNCWRSDCLHSQCPGTCRCPGPISKLLGRTSCY
ncbi:hypothetical protein MTO96_026941 [Rhipicephalus appendiculatus]